MLLFGALITFGNEYYYTGDESNGLLSEWTMQFPLNSWPRYYLALEYANYIERKALGYFQKAIGCSKKGQFYAK